MDRALLLGGCGLVATGVLALACSGNSEDDDATPVTCAWIEGDNCYKEALATTLACLPDVAETGSFAADQSSCTYASGHTVEFVDPIPEVDGTWHLRVLSSGAPCVEFEETGDSKYLRTPGGSVTLHWGDDTVTFTCPNGQVYSIGRNERAACAEAHLSGWGTSERWGPYEMTFSLHGDGAGGVQLFDCVGAD